MFEYDKYCLEGEIWKDIPEYEGLYQASTLGRIRSVDGKITYSARHGERKWKGIILKNKTKIPERSGYKVTLWKNKERKDLLVARLVCSTFHGDGNNLFDYKRGKGSNKITVNHKDGNRFNNRVENLEWLTLGDNIRHSFETGLNPTHGVILYDGNVFAFTSKSEASRFLERNDGYISGMLKKRKEIVNNKSNKQYKVYEIPF